MAELTNQCNKFFIPTVEKFLSSFEEKQARFRYLLQKIYKNKLQKKKLNVLNDNFKQKIR